jgi:N-acetylmuramoyl-L-alanine amidase
VLIKELYIPVNKNTRTGRKMDWQTITIHNTGNLKSTAQNERDWLVNPNNNRVASWNTCIYEDQVIKAIPNDEVSLHSGTAKGNNTSLSIEVCESGNYNLTLETTTKYVAMLLKSKNKTVKDVVTHKSWSGKNCPRLILPIWNDFIKRIEKEMEVLEKVDTKSNEPSEWAKDAWEKAVAQKIFDGTDPQGSVTREQLAVILVRLGIIK